MDDKREKVYEILKEHYRVAREEAIGYYLYRENYQGTGRTIYEFVDKILAVFNLDKED